MERETTSQQLQRFDLRALYDTSQFLSSSLDREFVLNNLLLTGMSKLLVTRGAVWLYDGENDNYTIAAHKGCKDVLDSCATFKLTDSASGVMTGDQIPPAIRQGGVVLAAPIRFGDRNIGIIGFGKKATGVEFSPTEVEFVKSLVNMTSSAVHNSLVVDELRTANRNLDGKIQQVNTLFDLSREFNSTVDRSRHARLLSLALMGQMMVRNHIFMVSRTETNTTERERNLQIVSCAGLPESAVTNELLAHICDIHDAGSATALHARNTPHLKESGIELVVPFVQQGATTGALFLGERLSKAPYSDDDVEFIYALGNLALVAVQNSFLIEEQIEKERLEEEMRLARQIQENLQPKSMPDFQGVDLAMLALPSRHVAGDYLDIVKLSDERLLLAIGDVTGKGVPASLLMSNLQAALHVLVPMEITLEEATAHINRVISGNTDFDKFITYFHCIYNSSTHVLDYVNAGHNPPYLIRGADGSVEELEEGGLLLGVMSGSEYQRGTSTITKGDVIVLFTDGVTEAMSPEEEEYGEERLLEVLSSVREGTARDILDAIHRDVIDFTGSATALSDDLTMVVMKLS